MKGRDVNGVRGRLSAEAGFSMIEVLVVLLIGLMVVAMATQVFTAAVRSQPGQTKKGVAIQQARTIMERIVRELRQGSSVYTATSQQLSFVTYVHTSTCSGTGSSSTAIACRVTYTCTAGSCTRAQANPDGTGSGSATTMVTGLSSSNVFNYSPSSTAPSYIGATLTFPGSMGDDAITLTDGATLRNPSPATS